MADVTPFRAQRYDPATAGPLEALVAPPYDVISPEQRVELQARNPYNVVHLTLPDSEEAAGATYRDWLERGILLDEQPAVWALAQEYVGPDGVPRRREGLVASLRVEPYESGVVLPHEQTHPRVKEGRLRLLRATEVQLEPIFLLYDGPAPAVPPERAPDLAVQGAQLWRLDGSGSVSGAFADKQLLIADGHHRYETALAYHREQGTPESAQMLVVLVSTEDPGLEIFPTHRVFSSGRELAGDRERVDDPLAALAVLDGGGPAVIEVTGDGAAIVRGNPELLDVQLVDTVGHEGLTYTPDAGEAVGLVREGAAAVAYLMRPTRIEDVFAAARRGDVLPPKTTYFFPKLISGLLFHPLG